MNPHRPRHSEAKAISCADATRGIIKKTIAKRSTLLIICFSIINLAPRSPVILAQAGIQPTISIAQRFQNAIAPLSPVTFTPAIPVPPLVCAYPEMINVGAPKHFWHLSHFSNFHTTCEPKPAHSVRAFLIKTTISGLSSLYLCRRNIGQTLVFPQ